MVKKTKEYKRGDFVFAKVKGYPAWPARVRAVMGKNKYTVNFYGTNETANLNANVIFDYAQNKYKFLSKGIKRKEYSVGVDQIEKDISDNVQLPDEDEDDEDQQMDNVGDSEEVTTLAGDDTTAIGEGDADDTSVLEDTTDADGSGASNNVSQEEDDVQDSEDAPLIIDETKRAGSKRGSTAAADSAHKPKQSRQQEKSDSDKTDPEDSQPQEQKEEETVAPTDKLKKTPKSGPKNKRVSRSSEVVAPRNEETEASLAEVTSRSGRKIKPKRFLDENSEEDVVTSTPLPKKIRSSESNRNDASDETPQVEDVPSSDQTPQTPTEETEAPVTNNTDATTDKSVTVKRHESESKPTKTPNKTKAAKKTIPNDGRKSYNIIKEKDIENMTGRFKAGAAGDDNKVDILVAKLITGEFVGIKLFPEKHTNFKNELAQSQWETIIARNSLKLKQCLENGNIRVEAISDQLVKDLNMTAEEKAVFEEEYEYEEKKRRINFLKIETRLTDIEIRVRRCLGVQRADVDLCITLLDEMADLDLTALMLLKHPTVLEMVKRMRRYVGNPKDWNLTEEAIVEFRKKAHIIRKKAEHCFNLIKSLFSVPEGVTFFEFFAERLITFGKHTANMSETELLELVAEPPEMLLEESLFLNATAVDEANETARKTSSKKQTKSSAKAKNGVNEKATGDETRRDSVSSTITSDSETQITKSNQDKTPSEIAAK